FLDNFTGTGSLVAHVADSGEAWSGGSGAIQLGSGSAYGPVGGGDEVYANYTPASADCEVSIRVIKGALSGAAEVGMWLRGIPPASSGSGYMGRYVLGSGWQFYRMNSGAYTQIGVSTAGTLGHN